MAEIKDRQLVFVDEKGEETLCQIIFTYDSAEYKKSYVFFTPEGSADEDGKVEVGVASYIPKEDGIGDLEAVEDEAEWDMLAEVFDAYVSEHDHCDCDCDCDGECDGECDCEDEDDEECGCCCCHHHKNEE